MSRWLINERKKQMRLNIIRHRQKLLKYLDNINDTVLKPKIKLNSLDLEKIKQESLIPVTVENLIYNNYSDTDDNIFVGSTENNQLPEENFNSEGISKCIESVHRIRKKNHNKDYIYSLDNVTNNTKAKMNHIESKKKIKKCEKFKRPIDRRLHNAKERACRNKMSKLFLNLSQYCSTLDCTRRIPAKQSILKAAKLECVLLKNNENWLIEEKKYWRKENIKMKMMIKYASMGCINNLNDDN